MLNPPVEKGLKEGDSKYTLVMLTSKRSRQIIEGASPLIETNSKKAVTIAMEEIAQGKVTYKNPSTNSIK